jgi:hypothetical protein
MKRIKEECLIHVTLQKKIVEMIFDAENYKNGESVEMYNIESIGNRKRNFRALK